MLINKLKHLLSDKFIRNVGWLGASELVNRIFRLGVTVTLARLFRPYDYGLVSVVYTTFEFAMVLSLRGGTGAKIIQANEQDVKAICDTSYWLNWILCGALFIIQCVAAFPIAQFYGNNQLILPLCTIALTYLMLPGFLIQESLLQRENRLEVVALCQATQGILSNTLTIGLALLGMGVWAIVWAMVLTTPVWIVINYRNHPWRPPKAFTLERWKEIINFGKNLLGVELLGKVRGNLDYLLIGGFLGIDALGVYYFAFNAGLGISLSVIVTLTSALFPYLCEARGNFNQFKTRYFGSLKKIALIVVPLVVLQSSLAPLYVPIIFGQKWVGAIPILVLICLSAVPMAFARAASQLLQAVDKSHIDLYWNIIFTVIFATSLLLAMRGGIYWVAAAVLIAQAVALPIFTIWVSRSVFAKKSDF
jgi:PST family polysaccharide transporter